MIKLPRLRHILMSKCSGQEQKDINGDAATSATSATAVINLNTFRPINFTRLKGPVAVVMDRAQKPRALKGSASCHASASIHITSHSFCSCPFVRGYVCPPISSTCGDNYLPTHLPLMCDNSAST
ncbi:hypothetical protein M5D96_002740 [Drosophila gunungcola]|uniref:Uncharacterized protein n=1 Tax=Drosophila gunungcola TaxID=103775 RepID=A0A9P9Z1F1_9MUSC|nr:hypothetical protein M5D96_002740 [Drosophila gunungcola]